MAKLFELFVSVIGDNSSFKKAIKNSSDSLSEFEKLAVSAGAKIAGALTFAAIAKGALDSAEKFQEAGFKIQRSTGATGTRLDAINESFKNLYRTSGATADVIGDSIATITRKTGASGKSLESLTKANLQFAKVTGTDVKQAIDSTQVVFKQWGVTADDQARKLDVLYKIQTLTGISTEALGTEMAAVGPTMRAFGFTFNESVAYVGAFEEAGLKASDMVKGMNAAFVKFAAAGKDPKQALADLIEKLKDTRSSAEATNKLIEAGFSARSVIAMADAAKRGALDFGDLKKKVDSADGSVAEMAKKTTSLSTELVKLWHSVEIGLADPGPGLLSWITQAVRGFNELANKVGVFSAVFAGGMGSAALVKDAQGMADLAKRNLAGQTFGAKPSAPTGGGGAASTGIPDTLNFKTLAGMMSFESAKLMHATFQDLLQDVTKWYAGLTKIEPVMERITDSLPFKVLADAVGSVAQSVELPARTFDESLNPAIQKSEALMHSLGLASTRELRAQYDAARKSVEAMILLNASQSDVEAGAESMAAAWKKLQERLGAWDDQAKKSTKTGINFAQQVSTAVNDLAKSLASVVMGEKSIGDAFKDVGKTILRVILEDIITTGIGALMKSLSGLLSHLGSVGKALGGLFGGGASAAGSAAGSVGGGASSAASAAGSVAGTGVSAVAGIVTGAVSAVSSVIGNFQMYGMNKSLDLIVKHTLQTANDMFNLRRDLWDQHNGMRAISNMIYDRLGDMWGTLRTGGGGGGKGGITFTNCTFSGSPQQNADAIFTQWALAGG